MASLTVNMSCVHCDIHEATHLGTFRVSGINVIVVSQVNDVTE